MRNFYFSTFINLLLKQEKCASGGRLSEISKCLFSADKTMINYRRR